MAVMAPVFLDHMDQDPSQAERAAIWQKAFGRIPGLNQAQA